ncbi:uncharacterized protein METZ01_LOCUS446351, partial [marine metagenome]
LPRVGHVDPRRDPRRLVRGLPRQARTAHRVPPVRKQRPELRVVRSATADAVVLEEM